MIPGTAEYDFPQSATSVIMRHEQSHNCTRRIGGNLDPESRRRCSNQRPVANENYQEMGWGVIGWAISLAWRFRFDHRERPPARRSAHDSKRRCDLAGYLPGQEICWMIPRQHRVA